MLGVLCVLLACAPLCWCVAWWWRRRRMLRLAAQLPTYPGYWPLMGHNHLFIGVTINSLLKLSKDVSDHAKAHGGISTLWILMTPHCVVTDAADVSTVLRTCLNKSYLYSFWRPWLGNGMFIGEVSTWIQIRRLLTPAFNPGLMKTFQPTFDSQARKLAQAFADQANTKLYDPSNLIDSIVLETVYETKFGRSTDGAALVRDGYAGACHNILYVIMKRLTTQHFHFDFIFNWSTLKRDQDKNLNKLKEFSTDVIHKGNPVLKKENKYKIYIELLMEQLSKGVFNEKQVVDEVSSITFAAHDTTATTLRFILVMLGSHQSVQDRAYEEIREIFGDSDSDVNTDDLTRLVYLEAVINETIRLYPITPFLARNLDMDVKLKNHTLPAGTKTIIPVWEIHRDPVQWGPDAKEFRPERWLDSATMPEDPNAFVGFSLGKRGCLGKAYAMMSLKTTLVHLLRRCRLFADRTKLVTSMHMMLQLVSGGEISIGLR